MTDNKKTTWSLQNDKRSETERNAFKPTGKQPKNKTLKYLLWVVVIIALVSFTLTFLQDTDKEVCLTPDFCFSSANVLLYTVYIFVNIMIVILAIYGAYVVGKAIGNKFKL